jgi:hypothetical protein
MQKDMFNADFNAVESTQKEFSQVGKNINGKSKF